MTNVTDHNLRFRIFMLLVALMVGVYMLTYRALIQAGDTRRAFDAVTSYARYGDWLMDETNWLKLPFRIQESDALPLGEYNVAERLNIRLASPLLRFAEALPRLGNIHTVWLFNIIITSLNVGFIYLILRSMSFSQLVAVTVAASAGLGTNFWAYSQTFFREPLAAFFILATLLALQLGHGLRAGGRAVSIIFAAIGMFLAFETKSSAIFALPAAIVFALPKWNRHRRRNADAALVGFVALPLLGLCVLMFVDPLPAVLQNLLTGIGIHIEYASAATRAYILSPGASIWATSPLALLAVPGVIMFWKRGQRRLVATICLLFAGYIMGHALLTGRHWFGGLSWPPRFLLPMLPVLMLATAPVAEEMFRARRKRLRLVWIALLCYGIWIQFVGASLSLNRYSQSLPPEAKGYAEWEPSLTQPRYFRWFVLPGRWRDLGFEFLWTRAKLPLWGLSFIAYTVLTGVALAGILRQPSGRWRHLAPLLALLCTPVVLINLMSAYDRDPRTQSGQRALHEALAYLASNARADDVLLLAGPDSGDFILNHMDAATPRPIILDRPLAQAASPKQPALVVSANPNDWFDVQSLRTAQHLAGRLDRIWALSNTSPFMRWSHRSLERYLAQHYYPLGEVELPESDETVRLLAYSTRSAAPNPMSPYAGDDATDLQYGGQIRLLSLVLPNGSRHQPGETVELSLLWQTDAPLKHDYTVAWFIVDPNTNLPIAQGQDSGPQAGFAPTSTWKPRWPVWDNRALRLPENAAPGEYQIWVLMYRFDGGSGDILRLPVRGAKVREDGTVGVLPVSLTVE
ncbi:MAG: hypothetical protein OXG23_05940 [Chloroflexi bacterium]|nr:hypothetical protein [Chloroflexota bacterium]